jgi:hypothetical protein
MRTVLTGSLKWLIRLTCLSVAGAALVAGAPKARPVSACEARSNWIAVHANELPKTLEEIAAYPKGYRSAIFNALSPEVKSGLAREQLSHFLASESLSAEQRKFVQQAIDMATPEKYSRTEPLSGAAAEQHKRMHEALSAETRRLFSPSQVGVFVELGYGITSPTPARLSLPASATDGADGKAESMFDCQCASTDPYCGAQSCPVIDNCTHTDSGCGWLWCAPCDGMCVDAPSIK